MSKKFLWKSALALAATAALVPAAAVAQDGPKLQIGGTTYTKWLYGNLRDQGAMFNFTTIPGEGYGDNGQGTELELLLNARLSSQVEVTWPHPQPLQPELLDELRRLRWRPLQAVRGRQTAASSIRAPTST